MTFHDNRRRWAILLFIVAFLLLFISNVFAADEYKPYLHKAEVPEHPKVKLYGTYSTSLFPGAATYSYQIDVPPGTNGLQPQLVISYNSQNMNQRPGILGAGWGLSLSYVFRDVNSTPYNASDDEYVLILNGQVSKLVYNATSNVYQTEIEAYARIENLSTSNNSNSTYWLVTSKDGKKYQFGNRQSSELASNTGKGYALKWSLDSIQDTYGNNVTYYYVENPFPNDNGTVYLDNITYSNEGYRVVKFFYEGFNRPDMRLVYEQGNVLQESRRLIGINVSVNGSLVRRYAFTYAILNAQNSISSLSNISFIGSDGASKLHNVQFGYYNSTPGWLKNGSGVWDIPEVFDDVNGADTGVRLVDVNNDGFVDVVRSRDDTDEKKVWINNRTNGWNNESGKWVLPVFIVDNLLDENGVRFADLNGDGFTDIIQSITNNNGPTLRYAYLNNGSGWVDASSVWNSPVFFVWGGQYSNDVLDQGVRLMDVNGDGLVDLVQAMKPGDPAATKLTYLNNGSGWNKTELWTVPALFNGVNNRDEGLREVDLNGDSLVDLIEAQNFTGSTVFNAWLNNGSGWINYTSIWRPPASFVESATPDLAIRFMDVNGDGLTDIIQSYAYPPDSVVHAWINNGNGFTSADEWVVPEYFALYAKNVGRRIADIDGDGMADVLVSYNNVSGAVKHVWTRNSTMSYLLKSIKTELGANVTISYQNSTYFNNTNASGMSQLGFNIQVVDTVVQNNSVVGGFNAVTNYSYNYLGGFYDYKDREFRGFSQVTEVLPDGAVVKHYFHQGKALKGMENRTDVYGSSGNLFSKTENTYNFTQSGGVYENFLTSAATYAYDGAAANPKVSKTAYAYDDYGNVVTRYSLGDVSVAGDEKLELYDYVYNTTANILNAVSRHRLFAADNTTRIRDAKYIYDGGIYGSSPSRSSVTAVESWLDAGSIARTESTYGSSGELLTETDALGRTTKYRYDGTKTFVEQVINPLGHITRFSYDKGTGNLLWIEKNGIRTSYEYDVFGRISKEIQPYDTSFYPTKSYNYSFDGTAPESIKVSQRTTANKTLDTYYYYDGFGNLVQLKTPSYDNKQVVKNFFYDGSGRVRAVQSPYFDSFSATIAGVSATASYTNYGYDAMARVTNVTNPDATTATVVFDRWRISTYDENNHRKDYVLDAYDRIVKVQEFNIDPVLDDGIVNGYNTSYGYDAADQLVQINDTYGNQFRFAYDSLGRRTRLNDPDIGEWNYSYDLVGNLISQAGGGGNLVSGDGFYREYNTLNQLVRIRNGSSSNSPLLEQYYYDPFNERIKIWRNDTAGTTVYTPFRELMQIRNSSGVYNFTYVYDGSTLVARVNPDQSVHYYHPDHLGSTTLITDQNGNVVEETFYEPYGAVTSGGNEDVKLYTGQFSDELTNQYYYGARYYLPSIGVYGQADPVIQNVYDPQFLNHYSYVRNNPYLLIDPDGKIAIARGLGVSGGVLPVGGSGSLGLVFSYSREYGFQASFYGSLGKGAYSGYKGSLFAELSVYPFARNLDEFKGNSLDTGIDLYLGLGGGLKGSFPERENEEEKRKNLFYDVETQPNAFGVQVGVGEGVSASGFFTSTHVSKKLSVGGYHQALQNTVSHITQNTNINNNMMNSLINDVRNTFSSGNNVKWYYNTNTGTYQYWAGKGKPNKKGLVEISKNNKG